ncbi:MAG: N-acetylglutaminylglutamine amidotransferase [Proteobacteria bacterium]|nr:N-acetylglutaminylglutamine amidotransferase [Pseudomonadota bacterium]
MCGICGEISFNGTDSLSLPSLQQMVDKMASRGPDASGMKIQDNVALGHRRLKIIDLSDCAEQPMTDAHLGLTIVYNGAVYNYKELRDELSGMGYTFFSKGDTEVILKAYHAWGKDCVRRFNGMFAFAILERDTKRVVIGRDRLGIKPLYYVKTARNFRFSSSLPSLLSGNDISHDIDPVSLHYYLTFHSVIPSPFTILKSVRKLPPAHTLTINPDGSYELSKFWDLDFKKHPEEQTYSFEDWAYCLKHALKESIQKRLTADVPVGVLLSGGLDSSLIVGLLKDAGIDSEKLNTFSIGFESVDDENGNEFRYSDLIAEHFDTVHHKINIGSTLLLSNMDACIRAMSEPMSSHDCIGFYLLSQSVSKVVKVVQSGQGADEVFGGYHWHPPMMVSENVFADYQKYFFDCTFDAYKKTITPDYLDQDFSAAFVSDYFNQPGAPKRPIDKVLDMDTRIMLVDDPVKRVDNMTMAWGLEARVPFLDHELVELAARIPSEYKVSHGGKYILKEIARHVIPEAVIDRPKGYFPVPVLKYFRGRYFDFVKEILTDDTVKKRGLFSPKYVEAVIKNPDDHITPLRGARLWQMAVLEYWLSVNAIS